MNKEFVEANMILRGPVGSEAYGTALPGSADHDEMGIFVESEAQVMGLDRFDTHIERDAAEGERSKPGDLELTCYSLRKFASLAINGNPTVLEMLFLPKYTYATSIGRALLSTRSAFTKANAGPRYLGYLIAQKQKMKGERAHTVKRQDLLDKFGYDTKFAMHAIRLGLQGIEFLQTSQIKLPCPQAQYLLDIRNGKYTEAQILDQIDMVEDKLRQYVELNTQTHEEMKTNREIINHLLVKLHKEHWNAQSSKAV